MNKFFCMLATASLLNTTYGTEFQINEELFEQTVSITGIAKPLGAAEVSITPTVWKDFVIEKVVPHGTKVKKGDTLVWVDTEACDDYLKEQVKERELDAIQLQSAQKELEELKASTERALARAQRSDDRVVEDYKHYTEVEKALDIEKAKLNGDLAKWKLESVEEELKQLLKMYEEDGLTEETEEIILKRHKNSVKYAVFSHKLSEAETKRDLEVVQLRSQADKKRQFEKAAIDLKYQQRTLAKSLKEKEISVAKLLMADAKKAKKFAGCKADREAMSIVAPQDGYVYYGAFEANHWKKDVANKHLYEGSKLPTNKVFLTVVPNEAKMAISASVDSSVTSNIEVGSVGQLRINSNPWSRFESKVTAVSSVPNMQSAWSVELSSELPEGQSLKAGEGVLVNFTTYKNEKAMSVPVEALTEGADGSFSVQLKMADGESKKTVVTLGKNTAKRVEVLSGLSAGQVITYGDE